MENNELKHNQDFWDLLSDDQKRHINEGIDDEENGRAISSEEFWKNLKSDETPSRATKWP